MNNEIQKVKEFNRILDNRKFWSSEMIIPEEMVKDEDYLQHTKNSIMANMVNYYVENCGFKPKFNIRKGDMPRTVKISTEVLDIFALKDENERLRKELSEMVDKYMILKDTK